MPSPNTRYSPEFRQQTAEFILSSGRSATRVSEEMGIDVNTVCNWVREHRRTHGLPTYAEGKGFKTPTPVSSAEFRQRTKDFERDLKRTEKLLKEERERDRDLEQIPAYLHATTKMKYEAILRHSPVFAVEKMCKALGLKSTAYRQWKKRRQRRAERAEAYRDLTAQVRAVFEDNRRVYGYRKMWRALSGTGLAISEYKVRRIMREAGLYPITTKRFRPGRSGKAEGRFFDNTLDQQFHATRPDEVWAGDITYIKTKVGWAYLAVVIDLFNREVIGHALSKSIDVELVKRALSSAVARRSVTDTPTVFHSDRGIQYASAGFMRMLADNGIVGSMSKNGCPFDNAVAESFASAKRECIHHRDHEDFEEVKRDTFAYSEPFYNRKRMHSTLGYKTPVEYRLSYLEHLAP